MTVIKAKFNNNITPEDILQGYLDQLEQIESVVVIAVDKEGTLDFGFSTQDITTLIGIYELVKLDTIEFLRVQE